MQKNDSIMKTDEFENNKTTDSHRTDSHRINEIDLKKEFEFISDVSDIPDGKKEETVESDNSVTNGVSCDAFKETIKNKKSVPDNRDNTKNSAQINNEKRKNKNKSEQISVRYLIKLIVILTCICAAVALLLSTVNCITKDVISDNKAQNTANAVKALFPDSDSVIPYEYEEGKTLYAAEADGVPLGYAVKASGSGYGGEVEMMIGVDVEKKICGIKILSHSETPGVGSKITADGFLSRFFGLSESVTIGENIDGISGATYSSKSVAEGVNYALDIDVDLEMIVRTANSGEA